MSSSSNSVVNHRLKNGQCIHCGNQTHTVVKKMLSSPKFIPLTVAGSVDNGRCLADSCLLKASNGDLYNSNHSGGGGEKRPSRISGQTMATVAGAAASVTGAVLSELGLPGGEIASAVGEAVSQVAENGNDDGGIPQVYQNNNPYADMYSQILQQQQQSNLYSNNNYQDIMENYQQQMQQLQQQQQQQSNPYQDMLENYTKQMQQLSLMEQQQAQQTQNNYTNMLATYEQQILQAQQQQQQQAAAALAHQSKTPRPPPIAITCPNHHKCCESPDHHQCDVCGGAHGTSLPMVGCLECNWDICYTCASHHQDNAAAKDNDDDHHTQLCPCSHHVYCVPMVWPQFHCNYCLRHVVAQQGTAVYYCSICDWGTCGKKVCGRKGIRTPPVTCPRNHSSCLAIVPSVDGPPNATFHCQICVQRIGDGTEMYHCFHCNWSICASHQEQDAQDDDGCSC